MEIQAARERARKALEVTRGNLARAERRKAPGKGPGGAAEQSGLLGDGMRGDRRRVRRGGVKDLKDRELLERLRKVESIPVKVYGQDGETICFEVQVGLAGVMVPGKGSVERHSLEDREESAWESG